MKLFNLTSILDPAHYSSHGVREQTAELASLALSLNGQSLPDQRYPSNRRQSYVSDTASEPVLVPPLGGGQDNNNNNINPGPGSSALTAMIRNPTSAANNNNNSNNRHESFDSRRPQSAGTTTAARPNMVVNEAVPEEVTETTSLVPKNPGGSDQGYGIVDDIENQAGEIAVAPSRSHHAGNFAHATKFFFGTVCNPKAWDGRSIWQQGVVYPTSLLPSVFLGLLLNVLDALSYGMILFPLGEPLFADLGSDGISMFYVSTIISQLFFSCGGSIFKGGIGSEMIEVVPFFHKMAFMILNRVGEDNPHSVLATTILSFSISSILTGLVFLLMGTCRLGSLIGFFPRHILIGCIGGVGWFLVATGVEVSARLPGPLEYTGDTLKKLILEPGTLVLWGIPLGLAVGLLVLKRFIHANFLVGVYFITVAAIFYLVKWTGRVSMNTLRDGGWVFASPASSNPWYHFYMLYGRSSSVVCIVYIYICVCVECLCAARANMGCLYIIRFLGRRLDRFGGHDPSHVCPYILWRAARADQCAGLGHLHRGRQPQRGPGADGARSDECAVGVSGKHPKLSRLHQQFALYRQWWELSSGRRDACHCYRGYSCYWTGHYWIYPGDGGWGSYFHVGY